MTHVAVVHLARKRNGIAPFRRFIDTYRTHPSGREHELTVYYKGFEEAEADEYRALLSAIPHRAIFVPDRGFDINVYFDAVQRIEADCFFFLNSYSCILADGWLEALFRWVSTPGVGLVGATASYQSISSGHLSHVARMKSMSPLKRARTSAGLILADSRPATFLAQRAWTRLLGMAGMWNPVRDFPAFPNYHLRTNAFMASRETLRRIKVPKLRLKLDAYKFESGTESLTNQVLRLGQRVLVVGKNGAGYDPEQWHESNTFWQSREENLLVSDNQTEFYLRADPHIRAQRSKYAWGDFARPA